MKAFTQLIENKVMVSTLPKPDYRNYNGVARYALDLEEFNDSIIGEAENVAEIGGIWLLTDIRTHPQ